MLYEGGTEMDNQLALAVNPLLESLKKYAETIEQMSHKIEKLEAEYQTVQTQLAELLAKKNMTPLERLQARFEAERPKREALRQQIGDPLEALASILADVPREIMDEDLERDENGELYINWRKS